MSRGPWLHEVCAKGGLGQGPWAVPRLPRTSLPVPYAIPVDIDQAQLVRCEPAAILVGIADEVEAEGWFPFDMLAHCRVRRINEGCNHSRPRTRSPWP